MKYWVTEIKAIKPGTGELRTYAGPTVPGISIGDAMAYCENHGLGYCTVLGELISEIPCIEGTYEPDWDKQVDYDTENN